jgi:hypothetical protein
VYSTEEAQGHPADVLVGVLQVVPQVLANENLQAGRGEGRAVSCLASTQGQGSGVYGQASTGAGFKSKWPEPQLTISGNSFPLLSVFSMVSCRRVSLV